MDVISVRVAGFPYGFAAESIGPATTRRANEIRKQFSKESDEYKRLQIRKKRRGMAFVRAKREIDTLDAFPTLGSDKANNLGDWPVLQSYALHWGIEVRFGPKLDEVFGIGNDKQTVSPIEDFWRVLAKAEVDKAVRLKKKSRGNRARRRREAGPQGGGKPRKAEPRDRFARSLECVGDPDSPKYHQGIWLASSARHWR